MLGLFTSWLFFVLLGAVAASKFLFQGRPGMALGVAMSVSLLAATWIAPDIFGFPIEVRSALAVLFLIAFCIHPKGRFRFSVLWLDVILVSIFFVGILSDLRFGGLGVDSPIRLYGELVLPYFAGRFITMRPSVSRDVSMVFAIVATCIGLEAVFEGITGVNLWEKIFAPMDDLVKQGRGLRFGLIRASGPTRYSIFLGILLMLLTPWCVSLIGRPDDRKWVRVFGGIAFVSCIAGIIATVSRGPLVGMVLAGAVSITIVWPWTFKWFAGVAMIGLLLVFTFWEQAIALVESTQTTNQVRVQVVEVDGEYEAFSGSRNRLLVWEVYGPLVLKGGPLGFGTEAVSSFPPNIPGLPTSAKARATLGIVDNSYLLIGLRFGWIGIGLFVALLVGSIVTAIQLRRSAGSILYPDGPAFLTALASILVGVAFEIMTVFSSYDFMFWILFHCGIVAGLASLRKDMLRGNII